MKILMYGINLETVAQNDIHRYFLDEKTEKKYVNDIKKFPGVHELVLFTSSYRNELYLHVDETTFKHGDLLRYISNYTGKNLNEIILETYSKFNDDVINHLYTLASGMYMDDQNIPLALKNTENALHFALKNNTIGNVLFELFNKAIEYVLYIQSNPAIAPMRKGEFSKILNAIDANIPDIKGNNVVLVGENDQEVFLAKQLLFAGAQSVSICTDNEEFKEQMMNNIHHCSILPSISKLLKDLHIVDNTNSSYRISSGDIVILLSSKKHYQQQYQFLVKDINEIRLTKKKQIVLDFSEIKNEVFSLDNSIIYYLDGITESKKNFTNEEIENAFTIFDESLELEVKKFMDRYSLINGYI